MGGLQHEHTQSQAKRQTLIEQCKELQNEHSASKANHEIQLAQCLQSRDNEVVRLELQCRQLQNEQNKQQSLLEQRSRAHGSDCLKLEMQCQALKDEHRNSLAKPETIEQCSNLHDHSEVLRLEAQCRELQG